MKKMIEFIYFQQDIGTFFSWQRILLPSLDSLHLSSIDTVDSLAQIHLGFLFSDDYLTQSIDITWIYDHDQKLTRAWTRLTISCWQNNTISGLDVFKILGVEVVQMIL